MSNPLLDFTDLPLFDRIQPGARGARHRRSCWREAERRARDGHRARLPGRLGRHRRGARRRHRAPGPRLGRGQPPQRRGRHAGAARRLQRGAAAGHRFWTRLGADERLYAKYKAIDPATLERRAAPGAQERAAQLRAVGRRTAGRGARSASPRSRSARPNSARSSARTRSTRPMPSPTTPSEDELAGVPDDVRAGRPRCGRGRGQGRLQAHAEDAQLPAGDAVRRQTAPCANACTAPTSPAPATRRRVRKFDNSALIREILALRQEEAQLLGYRNFGEVSVVPKMARVARAGHRLPARPGAARASPYAEKDVADMRAFAAEQLGIADPQAWDWPYIGEKLKEARYAFSEQEVKQYFTAPKVLAGLFKIVETLFEVAIRRDEAPVWNPASSSTASSARRGGSAPAGRPVLPRPVRAHRQARRRLDGRRARALAAARQRPAADAGGAPGLQLRRRRGRQAAAADARRRDHAVPRVRPWPAPHADAGQRARRVRHQRRRVGRGGAAQPVHGELLLGMGRAAST